MNNSTLLLFSYGTLQNPVVQVKTFGRELTGYSDQLLGYQLAMIEIQDSNVIKLSSQSFHPIARANKSEHISGKVFKVTTEELAQSDLYEVKDYKRVLGKMASGICAWAYVASH